MTNAFEVGLRNLVRGLHVSEVAFGGYLRRAAIVVVDSKAGVMH
jgi:hypothetical protein